MPVVKTRPTYVGQSVILYLAPPCQDVLLVKLVNLVSEELQCGVLGFPTFHWSGLDMDIDTLLQNERFSVAIKDLSQYDHVAVATVSERYPAVSHLNWLQHLEPEHSAVVSPLAEKALSFISVGVGSAVSESFRLAMKRSAQLLNMSFLEGVYVQSNEVLRYSRAVAPVSDYVDRITQFQAA